MKPILNIADLVKNPNFGTNIVINESIDKVENAVVLDYTLDARKATILIAREYPNRPDTEVKQHVWLKRNTSPANVEFFAKLEERAYHTHGELSSDDFKEDFLPLYTAHLKDAFEYGDDPEVTKVTYGHNNVAHIQFTSQKKHITYDELGEEIETIVPKKHNARWTLLNPMEDYNNTVVVPRTLFNTAPKFLRLVAEAIDIDINRIFLKEDPTNPGVQTINVYFDPTDLIYAGYLPITITPSGEAIHIYDNTTGLEIEPEEPTLVAVVTPLAGTHTTLQLDVAVAGGPDEISGQVHYRPNGTTGAYSTSPFTVANGETVNVVVADPDNVTQYQLYVSVNVGEGSIQSTPQVVNRAPAPAPDPVISDLEYDSDTQTLTGLVQNATQVSIKVNQGAPVTSPVVDDLLSYMFTQAPVSGDVITVTAGTVSATYTLPSK